MKKKSFAEQVIDSMVDENGHCGERGLSHKQFDVLKNHLRVTETIERGSWRGAYSGIAFTEDIWEGYVGRYEVKLSCFHHFNDRCTVVSVNRWIDELPDLTSSEFVGEVKSRVELWATYLGESSYEREAYGHGYETVYVYKFMDADENLLVWKTTAALGRFDEEGLWACLKPGDVFKVRGTVKAHTTYNGTKQTALSRCKVLA